MNWHLFVNIQLAEHSCAHSILYYEMYHSSAGKCRFRLRAEHRKLCDRYKLRSKTRRLCVWDRGERGEEGVKKKRESKPLGHIKIFLPVEPFPMKREHSLFQTRSLEGTGSDRNVNWFQRNIVRRKSSAYLVTPALRLRRDAIRRPLLLITLLQLRDRRVMT